ncbi:hypothetical protein WICPIJ_000597 [Wickerhamomyces pijperi]|uniref:Uncharacterized protein n=1 Tax=Wickerhamomyces pijperi TaxID=599730 RepID=A0A9P8TQQ9_WICPI|nr:hypothetical protein WICPIJ_000597 [Wickerhamomyces pijperi]
MPEVLDQKPPHRRFSTNSTPSPYKPNSRSFEIYYDPFINLNKPVNATLLHFKSPAISDDNEAHDYQSEQCVSPDSTLQDHAPQGVKDLHSYKDIRRIYRSCSMPNVSSPPYSASSSTETLWPLNQASQLASIPTAGDYQPLEFSRRNSFISNCVHDHKNAQCPDPSLQYPSMRPYYNTVQIPREPQYPITRERNTSTSSESSWEDQLDEQGDLLKDTNCKRHHHRRGSVAIRFHEPKIVTLDEHDGSVKEIAAGLKDDGAKLNKKVGDEDDSWGLRKSLDAFTLEHH